jgi:hypothetical protein
VIEKWGGAEQARALCACSPSGDKADDEENDGEHQEEVENATQCVTANQSQQPKD